MDLNLTSDASRTGLVLRTHLYGTNGGGCDPRPNNATRNENSPNPRPPCACGAMFLRPNIFLNTGKMLGVCLSGVQKNVWFNNC